MHKSKGQPAKVDLEVSFFCSGGRQMGCSGPELVPIELKLGFNTAPSCGSDNNRTNMTSSQPSLSNSLYFPVFQDLPMMDDLDASYYMETAQGMLQPARTWCFVGEIVHDGLSQMPVLGHRVEVRDASGAVHSIMFYPTAGHLDFRQLKIGSTIFVRYASRCYFSDLATEAIKVEDLNFVKVVPLNLDSLLYVSQVFFEQGQVCNCCQQDISLLGGAAPKCSACGAAKYCSAACKDRNMMAHMSFCSYCCELQEVYNVDFERFLQYVPFRM